MPRSQEPFSTPRKSILENTVFVVAPINPEKRKRQKEDVKEMWYEELQPIWWVLRAMGSFPMQRLAGGETRFRWNSRPMLYAGCFYLAMNCLLIVEAYVRLGKMFSSSNKTLVYFAYSALFASYLLPHLWLLPAHWRRANQVAAFCNDWTAFQVMFRRTTGHPLALNLRKASYITVVSVIIVSIATLIFSYFTLNQIEAWEIVYFSYVNSLANLQLTLWCFLCTAVKRAANQLTSALTQECVGFHVLPECLMGRANQRMAEYRRLWLRLGHLTESIGSSFCYATGFTIVLNVTSLLLSIYVSLILMQTESFLNYIGLTIFALQNFMMLQLFCNYASNATDTVGTNVKRHLQQLHSGEKSVQKELLLFETAICLNPPNISLNGFATVNRGLSASVLSTVVTYMVVLLQAQQNDENQKVDVET